MTVISLETAEPCVNCGQKHPIGMVSGVKKNLEMGCIKYQTKKQKYEEMMENENSIES